MITNKRLTADDITLARDLFTHFQIDDGEEPTFASDDYLIKLLSHPDFHVLVAVDGDKLAGGLTAYELPMYKEDKTDMFLYELGVHPGFRRQGVAKQLIAKLIEICRERNIDELFVDAEADNLPAVKLYGAAGGKPIDVVEFTWEIWASKLLSSR